MRRRMPNLYLIAGPNGAGKSTFGKLMVGSYSPGLEVFDGDIIYKNAYESIPKAYDHGKRRELANKAMHDAFADLKAKAITENLDFAYETNFMEEFCMEIPNEFKKYGYDTHIHFIGLDGSKTAKERVDIRVAKGGHEVSIEEIEFRYYSGIMNIMNHFQKFDICKFYENVDVVSPIAGYHKGILQELTSETLPLWFKKMDLPLEIERGKG